MTIDAMPKMSAEERAERRRKQAELAAELKTPEPWMRFSPGSMPVNR